MFTSPPHNDGMLHVLGCITQRHDLRLVVLAGLLCLFACVTAMSLMARARATAGNTRTAWLAAAGLVAGCGIWGTHFVAMLAFRSGFPVAYDPSLTILSVLIAILMCGLGFALTLGRAGPVIGGALTGAAIGAMHYVGMAAVRAPAQALWDWRYVLSSTVIGIAAMAFGMRVVMASRSWRSRILGAVIFTFAICSMHFTGMSAVTYLPDPSVLVPNTVVQPGILAVAVAAMALLIVALGLICSLVDSHLSERSLEESARLRSHIVELEATKAALEHTSESLSVALAAADAASQAKSAFLAAMSHELRTPLNAVIGFSETLSLETFGPTGSARNKDYINNIHASGRHLLALINDILDIARIDAGHSQLKEDVLDLPRVVTDSLRMVAHQAEAANIKLVEKIDADVACVYADERRLKQILINLLGNAVKFTQPKGQVSIAACRSPQGLAITVSDTGIGIAEKDIPKALEQFGQIDSTLGRKYEGTGLGLPLARQLTELHGGTLAIASKPNAGTIVTVTLPAHRIITPGIQARA